MCDRAHIDKQFRVPIVTAPVVLIIKSVPFNFSPRMPNWAGVSFKITLTFALRACRPPHFPVRATFSPHKFQLFQYYTVKRFY